MMLSESVSCIAVGRQKDHFTSRKILHTAASIACLCLGLLFCLSGGNTVSTKRELRSRGEAPNKFKSTQGGISPKVVETIRLLALPLLDSTDNIFAFDESDPRPIMNTFFSVQDRHGNIREDDAQTLAVWKHAWSAAGWNPRVLNLSHSERHPDYGTAKVDIETRVPMPPGDEYNQLCYLRHFAMAVVGGGWMSDYDTVPIGSEFSGGKYGVMLPNDGKFTSFEGHVPSLIVGSAEEWERVAKRLIEEGIKAKNNEVLESGVLFSDMHALMKLVGQGEVISTNVHISQAIHIPVNITADHVSKSREDGTVCDLTQDWWAIHFSHASTAHIGYNAGECKCRAFVMAETLQQLSDMCGGPKFHFNEPGLNMQAPRTSQEFLSFEN